MRDDVETLIAEARRRADGCDELHKHPLAGAVCVERFHGDYAMWCDWCVFRAVLSASEAQRTALEQVLNENDRQQRCGVCRGRGCYKCNGSGLAMHPLRAAIERGCANPGIKAEIYKQLAALASGARE